MMAHGTSRILHKKFRPSVSFLLKDICNFLPKCFSTVLNYLRSKLVKPSHCSNPQNSHASFDECGDSIPSEFSPTLSLEEDSCTHSLRKKFQTLSSVELPSNLCTPATKISQQVIQVTKPESLLSLHTPCTAPVPN
jgi:hypothetical protein